MERLKQKLRTWERRFEEKYGKMPSKEDVKRYPDVMETYKTYSKMKAAQNAGASVEDLPAKEPNTLPTPPSSAVDSESTPASQVESILNGSTATAAESGGTAPAPSQAQSNKADSSANVAENDVAPAPEFSQSESNASGSAAKSDAQAPAPAPPCRPRRLLKSRSSTSDISRLLQPVARPPCSAKPEIFTKSETDDPSDAPFSASLNKTTNAEEFGGRAMFGRRQQGPDDRLMEETVDIDVKELKRLVGKSRAAVANEAGRMGEGKRAKRELSDGEREDEDAERIPACFVNAARLGSRNAIARKESARYVLLAHISKVTNPLLSLSDEEVVAPCSFLFSRKFSNIRRLSSFMIEAEPEPSTGECQGYFGINDPDENGEGEDGRDQVKKEGAVMPKKRKASKAPVAKKKQKQDSEATTPKAKKPKKEVQLTGWGQRDSKKIRDAVKGIGSSNFRSMKINKKPFTGGRKFGGKSKRR
ncbi:hypothetical protein HK101_005588 [Irineochytrium annulatum]|nr:hypothetical protein HK101_005588 [Irineochytrium annulatum]